ncbi:MAG: hypothetical protein AB7S80_08495 [Rhizobiaceae bacterium]
MRSFIVKAILAATVVSASLVGAQAAGMNNPASEDRGYSGKPPIGSEPEMAGQHQMAPAIVKAAYRPRLAAIVHELGTANHRIRAGRAAGHLNRVEFRKLRSEAHGIRHQALATASRHEGRLPRVAFQKLQSQVRQLNRDIEAYARA